MIDTAPAKPLNRRQTAKAATRARILAAATALFETGSYAAASIRTIAAHAGMSTGAVFAGFRDKAELWTAVYGGPAPSNQIADEIARTLGQIPDCRWTLAFNNPGFAAAIHSPDFNPTTRQGQCWTAHGASPATALRKAREAATHAVRQEPVQ